MIFGIGCDIVKVSRFKRLINSSGFIERYFSPEEILDKKYSKQKIALEHYAVRFAAKEAFSKALGTGLAPFKLKEIYVQKEKSGKPLLLLKGSALDFFYKTAGKNAKIHLSLSHEEEYAMAYVLIESNS